MTQSAFLSIELEVLGTGKMPAISSHILGLLLLDGLNLLIQICGLLAGEGSIGDTLVDPVIEFLLPLIDFSDTGMIKVADSCPGFRTTGDTLGHFGVITEVLFDSGMILKE